MNDYLLALLLGVVEGLTEFLPISSTGHMLLVENLLGIDLEQDAFWKMFTVVIQLGAILAVVVFYAKRLRGLVLDFISPKADDKKPRVPRWRHPLVLVLAAVVPAGLIGVMAKKQIDALMEHALPIGLALLIGGILIEIIERMRRGRDRVADMADVSPLQALAIGFAQAVALIPGASRSASTIMGGRLCGLTTPAAADFSFLLSIPTMTAAAGYSLYKHRVSLSNQQWSILAVGFVTAFVIALAVVAWFLHYLRRHGLRAFVIYRVLLGLAVIAAWSLGWLK
jgi:undecaprenyl-diphosphatase